MRPRSIAKRRAVDAADVLPDDLLHEIFARVAPGVLDLIRCAGTCARWFRLISRPAFLRRVGISPENACHRSSFLIGAFFGPEAIPVVHLNAPGKRKSNSPPGFFRLCAQQTGGERLTFTSFIHNNDGTFNYATPLVSRRGLLLVRRRMPRDWEKIHLAVCQPLLGARSTRLLPPPPQDSDTMGVWHDMTGYALITAAAHRAAGDRDHRRQPLFQVLFITICFQRKLVYAFSYSSAKNSWSAPIKCSQTFGLTRSGPLAGVVSGGIVHWLYTNNTNFYTLNISADAANVSLTEISIQVKSGLSPFPCVVGEGKLSFVNTSAEDVLELWTKREQDNDHSAEGKEGWVQSELMPLEVKGIEILSFAERSCVILMVQKGCPTIFSLDLVSKKIQPMIRENRNMAMFYSYNGDEMWRCKNHVLYEIDWPSYLFHLSARSQDVQ
uniref:F-box domain-containing protein n=1 Tax=Aegilops tauschii TaxID=37682 RepID=M8ATB4_AEGTA